MLVPSECTVHAGGFPSVLLFLYLILCCEPNGHSVAIAASLSLWLTTTKSWPASLNFQTSVVEGTEPTFSSCRGEPSEDRLPLGSEAPPGTAAAAVPIVKGCPAVPDSRDLASCRPLWNLGLWGARAS